MSRPTDFTQNTADEICARLVEGTSLAEICRDDAMPQYRTVYGWLTKNEQFSQDYARAREEQADADADAIGDMAAQVRAGLLDPAAARVAIDAYKWSAGKRQSQKYGDKISQDITNSDGSMGALFASINERGKSVNDK